MKTGEIGNIRHYRTANISTVVMVVLLSVNSIVEALQTSTGTRESLTAFGMVITLLLLIPIFRSTDDHSKLAFITPLVLLAFNVIMMMTGGVSNYFLLFCLGACGISCLYSNFPLTLFFTIVQFIVVGALAVLGYPLTGLNVPVETEVVSLMVFVFSCLVLIVLTQYATVKLTRALDDGNSFRTFLETTANYLAMVDHSNKVIYVSKPLSDLAGIDAPELAEGRSFTDLFPGRDLKLLAGDMLGQWGLYERDWEFVLDGQKRYFKAASNTMSGANSKGTLINLHDMTYLAERDEIAVMKDSMQIGLFFMDKNYVIQDHYSRYLEEMLSEEELFGRLFTDVISDSVSHNELEAIKDYFNMILERTYDKEMLDDINPLNELHYVNKNTGSRKVFQCAFATVERGRGELFILVTVYDITTRVELQERLAEEEAKRQEEMQSVFELIQVQPDVFGDFMEDMEYEFDNIDKIQKDESMTAHDTLVKIYQSIHAIKSNAVILGLNVFGNKVHNLESKIKRLREMEGEIPFGEMLNLTMDIEKISQEKEGFRGVIGKLRSYAGSGDGGGKRQNIKVLVESLAKAASKAATDTEKKIRFVANENDIDPEAIDKGPRRVMKDILMQLVRNSAVHGIEAPKVRKAKGKNEIGIVKLSIKMSEDHKFINIKLSDDGRGLDYKKIAEKAVSNKVIKKEEAGNKNALIKAIFAPGFSTAETEGVHAGRGIGLNLVRDRIKEVNGVIKLNSELDKGTVFFVSIPVVKPQPPKKSLTF